MKKRGRTFKRNVCAINPLFAMDATCRNLLATSERVAMDALLEHRATPDNMAEIETLIETSIRAATMARTQCPHLEPASLDRALATFHRAAWSLRHAKGRHKATGVYGLDAADRAALIEADQLVGEMRAPGMILRKTWLLAFRASVAGSGVVIPALEVVA